MELGVPVVCSNAASLPEVVKDAGLLVNPEDAREVAEAMKHITENPELAREFNQKRIRQSQEFLIGRNVWRDILRF